MDVLSIIVALSFMMTVVVALFAFYGTATATSSSAVRGRLQGLMSGTSVVETSAGVALRKTGEEGGLFKNLVSGNLNERLALQLERADLSFSPGEYIVSRGIFAVVGLIAPVLFIHGP